MTRWIEVFACALIWFVSVGAAPQPRLPGGFTLITVAERVTGATTLAVAPDGRVFVCEQTGALRVVKEDRLLERPFLVVKVDSSWERGLLGVAFDPSFAANQFVYVNYVSGRPFPHHVIARYAADGDVAVEGSEKILFEGDDQSKMPGKIKNGHQGGAMHFGPDGKLYVGIGEQTGEKPSQDLHSLLGKIWRLNADGSIPVDNPFYAQTSGKYRAIWCLGLRNPFCLAFQAESGRMFINDVGGAKEEIDEGKAGANYGWPVVEHGQRSDDPKFTEAIFSYPVASITGAAFCPRDNLKFPAQWRGKYFFADYMRGFIKTLDPEHLEAGASDFAENMGKVTNIAFGVDGSLYVLDRNAWVIDKDWKPGTGRLYRITLNAER
jgi:glucose/arabinose dehydrogenase